MALRVTDERLTLDGVPADLVARPLREHRTGPDGEPVEIKTRSRLAKLERVELGPAAAPASEPELAAAEERWLLDAGERRWPAISARYGPRALDRATALARAGVVGLRCRVDDHLAIELPPIGWVLTEPWQQRRANSARLRELDREQWRQHALTAADRLGDRCPPLTAALRATPPSNPTLPVLVYAAEDLVDGVSHAGPRAFSQAHFRDTKARDDVPKLLRAIGVDEDTLIRLGVRRGGRLGLAGPFTVLAHGQQITIHALSGPVLLRADQAGLELRLDKPTVTAIVENLQAAETLADHNPEMAVIYTAGVPGEPALALIAQIADTARRVLLVPDADLGGVRIAERVLRAAPRAELVDIGAYRHPPTDAWATDGIAIRGLTAALSGPAAALAHACLNRGYPVEQELATVEAIQALAPPEATRPR